MLNGEKKAIKSCNDTVIPYQLNIKATLKYLKAV